MKFCTNCGKELKEGARFCETCGFAVSGLDIEVDNTIAPEILNEETPVQTEVSGDVSNEATYQLQITDTVGNYPVAKPRVKFTKQSLIIAAAVVVIAIIAGIFVSNSIAMNKYKEKLENTYNLILSSAEEAEDYATLESKVWRNVIEKDSSWETDKYTKNASGYYYSDFNDALSNFYDGEVSTYYSVLEDNEAIGKQLSELKDCPEKFEEEYKALKELYVKYSALADLVIGDSSYSCNSFSSALESAKTDYKTAKSSAQLIVE